MLGFLIEVSVYLSAKSHLSLEFLFSLSLSVPEVEPVDTEDWLHLVGHPLAAACKVPFLQHLIL